MVGLPWFERFPTPDRGPFANYLLLVLWNMCQVVPQTRWQHTASYQFPMSLDIAIYSDDATFWVASARPLPAHISYRNRFECHTQIQKLLQGFPCVWPCAVSIWNNYRSQQPVHQCHMGNLWRSRARRTTTSCVLLDGSIFCYVQESPKMRQTIEHNTHTHALHFPCKHTHTQLLLLTIVWGRRR